MHKCTWYLLLLSPSNVALSVVVRTHPATGYINEWSRLQEQKGELKAVLFNVYIYTYFKLQKLYSQQLTL